MIPSLKSNIFLPEDLLERIVLHDLRFYRTQTYKAFKKAIRAFPAKASIHTCKLETFFGNKLQKMKI